MTTTHDRPIAALAERALAERVRAVPPSGIRKFFDIARHDGRRHQPRGGRARLRHARARSSRRASRSLREGRTHYTSNYGTLELRRALADHLERLYGVALRPGERDPASRSARPRPSTSRCARPATRATRSSCTSRRTSPTSRRSCSPAASAVHVATRLEDDFALDPAAVEAAITPRTKALFLGYPCNPTGAVLSDDVQDELAADRRAPRPARRTATRSTTASPTARTATARSARCRA